MSSAIIAAMASRAGAYRGTGINHEGQSFEGFLVLRPVLGKGVSLWFRAEGTDGTVYHEELSLVAPDAVGRAIMQSLNSNLPFAQNFAAERTEAGAIEFTFGDLADPSQFREIIRFEPLAEGALRYSFAWAMPGEAIQPRSAATLHRVEMSALGGRRPLP